MIFFANIYKFTYCTSHDSLLLTHKHVRAPKYKLLRQSLQHSGNINSQLLTGNHRTDTRETRFCQLFLVVRAFGYLVYCHILFSRHAQLKLTADLKHIDYFLSFHSIWMHYFALLTWSNRLQGEEKCLAIRWIYIWHGNGCTNLLKESFGTEIQININAKSPSMRRRNVKKYREREKTCLLHLRKADSIFLSAMFIITINLTFNRDTENISTPSLSIPAMWSLLYSHMIICYISVWKKTLLTDAILKCEPIVAKVFAGFESHNIFHWQIL